MTALLYVTIFMINIYGGNAGFISKCDIEGVDKFDWLEYFRLNASIDDTHEGLVTTFKTKYILEILNYTSNYLDATFSNNTLSIFTNERFKLFEAQYKGSSFIEIIFEFTCVENGSEILEMRQKVNDVNNHNPVLNRDVYEYNFGMAIPKDYDISNFIPISAKDLDFSNNNMHFTIDYNENFKISYNGRTKGYNGKDYFTYFKTLREITGPFREKLTLVAKDGGIPPRNTTALIIVTVSSVYAVSEDDYHNTSKRTESLPHPPEFSEQLYFANYTCEHNLRMEYAISMKYGVYKDIVVKQSSFQDYFKIELDSEIKGFLKVSKLKSLPTKLIETESILVMDIEAENQQFSNLKGHTTLILRLPRIKYENGLETRDSNKCGFINVAGVKDGSFVLFLSAICILVLINVFVYVCYCQKRKLYSVSGRIVPQAMNEPRKHEISRKR